jgi:hypothetical protein
VVGLTGILIPRCVRRQLARPVKRWKVGTEQWVCGWYVLEQMTKTRYDDDDATDGDDDATDNDDDDDNSGEFDDTDEV